MKIKQKLLSALLFTAFSAATIAEEKNIEVDVRNNNGVITKHITVNGVELDEVGIAKLEADGNVNIVHLADNNANVMRDDIEVLINTDGNNVTKKVIMNGKELNSEEIANLEASGQMQSFTMNTDDGKIMKKVVFINTGDDLKGSNKHESKVITKTLHLDSDNNATLGFIANIKEDGWHVISVVKNSGAEDAGLQAGDVLKMMGGIDLTNKIENIQDVIDLTHREAGEYIDLKAKRGDSLITFSVEARKNGSADIIMNNNGEQNIVTFDDANLDFSKKMSVIVTDGEGMNFDFNEDDINVVLPDDLNALKMYITQGDSTSELLGNNNKLSTLSEGLATYFNTDSGVLVLKAGANNAFALKDGDVIKSIDGNEVSTPKDVIKQLLKADRQEDIKIKIVRHKRNKTLKYNK